MRRRRGYDDEGRTTRTVSEEFDQFVDLVCDGDGEDAARFVADRDRDFSFREALTLGRCANYRRYGVGLMEEIASCLDKEARESSAEDEDEDAEG